MVTIELCELYLLFGMCRGYIAVRGRKNITDQPWFWGAVNKGI
jgi:hypothetical protein